eukprot:TRINITY_DN84293_c0_g1_i1.p1 TRINITY_DN84293_c0_g1~~TRINITY_DN84293_c0_g1_i1.p1  ORF type:complete len:348 (-),score=36.50 TRINITY_DN84293_c0_g1_i1:120-1163(-)
MAGDLTAFTPDPRATMPDGWESRSKGPDDDCIVNCVVLCLVQGLARPTMLCFGKDDPLEQELSKCPVPRERGESRTCSQRLRLATGSPAGAASVCGPIAFVGDSDIEWWEPWHITSWKAETNTDAIPVTNIGVGGGNLQDLMLRAQEIDSQLQPSVYVMICGENSLLGEPDCTQGHCIGMLRALLTPNGQGPSLVRRPRSHLRHVILFGAKRAPGTSFMYKKHIDFNQQAGQMIDEFNAVEANESPEFAHLQPRFIFHDLAQDPGLYPNTRGRGLYRSDGLHLSKKGYMVINNRLQQILKERVSLQDLPPKIEMVMAAAPGQSTMQGPTAGNNAVYAAVDAQGLARE